jgi:hypothetical protein
LDAHGLEPIDSRVPYRRTARELAPCGAVESGDQVTRHHLPSRNVLGQPQDLDARGLAEINFCDRSRLSGAVPLHLPLCRKIGGEYLPEPRVKSRESLDIGLMQKAFARRGNVQQQLGVTAD